MDNLTISFLYPWLLLLFIPAIIITFIPYFRISAKYRNTRNRISSIVLHLIVCTLAILTLAGIQINYTVPNEQNEIILLVDVSDTQAQTAESRDKFVESVIEDSRYDGFSVGVVTFGFDQVYAAPLSSDTEQVYQNYLQSELPDTSATNIAAAIEYASSLFNYPKTGKIVLVTDAKQTDEDAKGVIRSVISKGITMDAMHLSTPFDSEDFSISGITLPDYNVQPNQPCPIRLDIVNPVFSGVSLKMYDNGELCDIRYLYFSFQPGDTSYELEYTFKTDGIHELSFEVVVESREDAVKENNVYTTYVNIEKYNNVLILERDDQSQSLIEMLNRGSEASNPNYQITLARVGEEGVPTSVDQLRAYDQVILNNISNEDLKLCVDGFDVMLSQYVSEYGGSVFTIGGEDETGNANAYNRTDMYGSVYQQMLPVEAINYSPPMGVMIVLDTSGSMGDNDVQGDNYLTAAKAGAHTCLNAMRDKDYLGIMSLDSTYGVIIDPTPMSQKRVIQDAIDSIESASGGTMFAPSLTKAGEKLQQIKSQVAKLHIIVITDGRAGDDPETYKSIIKSNYQELGITMSIVGIGITKGDDVEADMQEAIDAVEEDDPDKKGRLHLPQTADELVIAMQDDLNAPVIQEMIDEEFKPLIVDQTSPLVYGLERGEGSESNRLNVTLSGFYGVRARTSADVVLAGDYDVPLYAEWQYGKGKVGSFMCDLQSSAWSSDFMASEVGATFIKRAVNNLTPRESIRPSDLQVSLVEDNYTNRLSVFTTLNKGEYVTGSITNVSNDQTVSMSTVTENTMDAPVYVTTALNEDNQYSRCYFVVKQAGVYKLELTKFDKNGNVLSTYSQFKSLAYSEEYAPTTAEQDEQCRLELEEWVNTTGGTVIKDIEDPRAVFEGFVTDIEKSYDTRFLFMILAIVLFLLDIAVRKFKFKWPHEIIRDWKKK